MAKVGLMEDGPKLNMGYNRFADKTAIGIVTCNRPHFLRQVLESLDPFVGKVYVINAGLDSISEELGAFAGDDLVVLDADGSKPVAVGRAKNQVMRTMRHDGFEYLFLIEDDVRVKDNTVFETYIETAAETGLWAGQLSYGTHGGQTGGNVNPDGTPKVRETVDYEQNSIDLYGQSFQAFTLYHANVIKILGYFDEYYVNAAEHLDHYYEAFIKGLGSYFWYFPDIENSSHYLEDIDDGHTESVIRKSDTWGDDMKRAWGWFQKKWNYTPDRIPRSQPSKVIERLNFIEENYARKDLL